MPPREVRDLTPWEVAAILGLDLTTGIEVVPFGREPFVPRKAPPRKGPKQILNIAKADR